MNRLLLRTVTLGAGAVLLAGCAYYTHKTTDVVHDNELTTDDFDNTVWFEAADGAASARPPVDVHEFDPTVVSGAGGVKLIDGPTWLDASDAERNQLLVDAQKTLPSDAIVVLVVATGEVWTLGPHAGELIGTGAVEEWSGKDYDELYEYYYALPTPPVITRADFVELTAVDLEGGMPAPAIIHDLGTFGRKELESIHGYEVLAPSQWNRMTPVQRGQELTVLNQFSMYRPQFQGAGQQPAFAVSVSWGMLYVAPRQELDNAIGWHSILTWSEYQIGSLADVPPYNDRSIRNLPYAAGIDLKF